MVPVVVGWNLAASDANLREATRKRNEIYVYPIIIIVHTVV